MPAHQTTGGAEMAQVDVAQSSNAFTSTIELPLDNKRHHLGDGSFGTNSSHANQMIKGVKKNQI